MKLIPAKLVLVLSLCCLEFILPAQAQAPMNKNKPDAGDKTFTVYNAPANGESLLSVPLYAAPGEINGLVEAQARSQTGETVQLQAKVLSLHSQDKSVRSVMLRGIVRNVQNGARFTITPQPVGRGEAILSVSGNRAVFSAGPRHIRFENGVVRVSRGHQGAVPEASVSPLAPDFPAGYGAPRLEIIENGPHFAWLACKYSGPVWDITMEIKADALGQVEFVSRLLARTGEHAFPQFGFSGELPAAAAYKINGAASTEASFVLLGDERRVESLEFAGSAPGTAFVFPDGAHIRQGRVEIEGARFRMWRDATLDKTRKAKFIFLEGQERSFQLALPAPGSPHLQHASGETGPARRAAAVMRATPTDWGDLTPMRRELAQLAPKLQSLDGDDWGDLTVSTTRDNPVYAPASLTRLDHGVDWMEDYYLGNERTSADVALRWAQNYIEAHLYRGANPDAYGAERYALTAENSFPNFNQKGSFLLMHAFEETGDPRFREAAFAAADRSAKLMETYEFLPSYGLDYGFAAGNNTRVAFVAVDLCKFYEYSGDKKYLTAARKTIEALEAMRARTAAHPDLTTNFHTGKKTSTLLSEGVGNPHALGDLALHSDEIGVMQSPGGFPKPFILDYHLRGSSAVMRQENNAAARSLLINTADYLTEKRNLYGSWGYAQAKSPLAMLQVTASIGDDLLHAYELTGSEKYLQAATEQAKLLVQLYQVTGDTSFEVRLGAGKPYFYAEDFTTSDLRRSSITRGWVQRDFLAHTVTFLNSYFAHFPALTGKLREPLQNENARWLVEKAPIANRADRPTDSIVADYLAATKTEPSPAFEETLAPEKMNREIGNCFMYFPANESTSDDEGGTSTLRLFEDGKELLPAHSLHANIRTTGKGAWSHWGRFGNRMVMFSSSDNSDPRTNGRKYVIRQEASGSFEKSFAAWEAFLAKYPDSPWEYLRLAKLAAGTPRETESLQKFVAASPGHPRAGTARIQLFRATNDTRWLRETIELLPGSIWAREAQTLLWLRGEEKRPDYVLADDRVAQSGFRETQRLQKATRETELTARREKDALVLRVVGHDWKKTAEISSSLHLYFDASENHERWVAFAMEADGPARFFTGPSWVGAIAAPQKDGADWSVAQTRQGDDLIFEVRIPFAKLGMSPADDQPVLLGLDVIRQESNETSFWCRSTKPDAIYPGNFGRLVLRPLP